jgi:hypothetical protein
MKIPKQEYTTGLNELAVKQPQAGQTIGIGGQCFGLPNISFFPVNSL